MLVCHRYCSIHGCNAMAIEKEGMRAIWQRMGERTYLVTSGKMSSGWWEIKLVSVSCRGVRCVVQHGLPRGIWGCISASAGAALRFNLRCRKGGMRSYLTVDGREDIPFDWQNVFGVVDHQIGLSLSCRGVDALWCLDGDLQRPLFAWGLEMAVSCWAGFETHA